MAFDQQSQRYVKFKGAATMLPHSIAEGDPGLRDRYEEQVDGALELYGEMLGAGVPGEDARFVFPNGTRTNLVMTTNLRALIHMSGLRLCTIAEWEIRRLFQLIRHEIFSVSPFLGSFLAPKCVPLGYCDEFKNRDEHCPIRPHKDRVLEAWAEKGGGGPSGRSGVAAGLSDCGSALGDLDPAPTASRRSPAGARRRRPRGTRRGPRLPPRARVAAVWSSRRAARRSALRPARCAADATPRR